MTAEGPTGAPLRQQIAEAIHNTREDCLYDDVLGPCDGPDNHLGAADAVLALLNLTEEWAAADGWGPLYPTFTTREAAETSLRCAGEGIVSRQRIGWTGPWLPSHHTDAETATQTCGGCGSHASQTIGVPCGVCGVHP